MLVCTTIPVVINGWGIYITYYEAFLQNFNNGVSDLFLVNGNHSFKIFAIKAFFPETITNKAGISEKHQIALLISNILIFIFALLAIANSIIASKSGSRIKIILALSSIYFFTHMVSGITWTAHLVTFSFTLIPIFLINNKTEKLFVFFLYALALFLSIEGSDTTGKYIYNLIRQYDVTTIFIVILFLFYSYLILKPKKTENNFLKSKTIDGNGFS